MRTLRFIVEGLIIKKDPACDFNNLVPGTEGYLQAEFVFSSEWEGLTKVAAFSSATNKEYPPQLLKDGRTCTIPTEALTKYSFKVGVIGKKNNVRLATNTVSVKQTGGAI